MNRRSVLSWLGVSAAGALHPLSSATVSARKKDTRIVAVESFCARDIDCMPGLHSYLRETIDSAMKSIHAAPSLYLEALIAPQAPEILSLTTYGSFDEMLAVQGRMSARPEIRQARALLESTRTINRVQSQVLLAARELESDTEPTDLRNGVFELSSLYAPAWQDGPPAHVMNALSRAGIRPIGDFLRASGEHLPQFTLLTPFAGVAASIDAWAKLNGDAEWSALQRESEKQHGSGVRLTAKAVYKMTPYSRLA
jgi:hypothetical protein